jgi:hypothetical protein
MRDYMRKKRSEKDVASVNSRKQRKPQLANAEVEAEAEGKGEAEEPPPSPPSASHEGFEDFWSAYPKKAGKGDALKAWKKLKCSKHLPLILTKIRALKISEQWTREGGQFIPHPATWLNREGWHDELPSINGSPALPRSMPLEYITEWPIWLEKKGLPQVEYQYAQDFLKSDFHKERRGGPL